MRIISLLLAIMLSFSISLGETGVYAQTAPQGSSGRVIDINSASVAELMTLPGVGEERSAAIIKNRPFHDVDELVSKKIMPPQLFAIVKNKVKAGE